MSQKLYFLQLKYPYVWQKGHTWLQLGRGNKQHIPACLLYGTSALGHMKAVLWEAQKKLDSFIYVSTELGTILTEGSFYLM